MRLLDSWRSADRRAALHRQGADVGGGPLRRNELVAVIPVEMGLVLMVRVFVRVRLTGVCSRRSVGMVIEGQVHPDRDRPHSGRDPEDSQKDQDRKPEGPHGPDCPRWERPRSNRAPIG